MRVLIIDGDKVANIAEFPEGHTLTAGQMRADDYPGVEIGDEVISGVPTPSAPPALPTIEERRETASMPKGRFFIILHRMGILSLEDAEIAAGGGWPPAFAGSLDSLTDEERAAYRIEWPAVQSIYRTNPLLVLVQNYMNADPNLPTLTDAQLDGIFEIT